MYNKGKNYSNTTFMSLFENKYNFGQAGITDLYKK